MEKSKDGPCYVSGDGPLLCRCLDSVIIIPPLSEERGNYVAVMCHSHKSKLFHYAAYVIHCWTAQERGDEDRT